MLALGLRGVAVVAILAFTGCTHDRSELYATASDAASAAKPTAELPVLPALPDPDRVPACEACAQASCKVARNNCLEDDDCSELLACKGKCSDPACLMACDAEHGHSAWYDDLWICVMNDRCGAACNRGENFACAGHYDWPVPDEPRFQVRFRFKHPAQVPVSGDQRDERFLAGAEVRNCRVASLPCAGASLIDSGRVDADNTVTLDYWATTLTFLEIEDERIAPYGWRERFLAPSVPRPMEASLLPALPELLRGDTAGTPEQQTRAPLGIEMADCLWSPARNVRVELPELPDVKVIYLSGEPTPFSDAFTTQGLAILSDIAESDRDSWITVRVVRVDSELVVAEGIAFVRAGWDTQLLLAPSVR